MVTVEFEEDELELLIEKLRNEINDLMEICGMRDLGKEARNSAWRRLAKCKSILSKLEGKKDDGDN